MIIFIIGGSGSGKSEYAEQRAVELRQENPDAELVYVATMEPMDGESGKRIERHRCMRGGKGFTTRECYTHLEELEVKSQEIVLLECLSNLTANEMFSAEGRKEQTVSAIKTGINRLIEQSKDVIVVGNNVFEDGITYDEMTEEYLRQMAELHKFLAEQADEVIEVICKIPVFWKGEKHEVH